jgi:hypothetical protein
MRHLLLALVLGVWAASGVGCHLHKKCDTCGCDDPGCGQGCAHGNGGCANGDCGCADGSCRKVHPWFAHHRGADNAMGPQGPPTGAVAYPYYTVRGPRDFLINNPPSIGN